MNARKRGLADNKLALNAGGEKGVKVESHRRSIAFQEFDRGYAALSLASNSPGAGTGRTTARCQPTTRRQL